LNGLAGSHNSCRNTSETAISAQFCDSHNDKAGCVATAYPPTMRFTTSAVASAGFNWKLWGGVGVGVVLVVVIGVVFMKK